MRHASASGMDGGRGRSARRSASKLRDDVLGYATVTAASVAPTSVNISGTNYNYYTLSNNQTVTITSGYVDLLVVGSGGGAGSGTLSGGACGGSVAQGSVYVPSGTYTATIGTYGSPNGLNNAGTDGQACSINMLGGISAGGGLGGVMYAGRTAVVGGSVPAGMTLEPGGNGGTPTGQFATSGSGGTGPLSSITGTALNYGSGGTAGQWDGPVGATAPGGGAGNGGAGPDGRGGGGGGGGAGAGANPTGGRGGLGTVIVRVKV